MTKEERRQYKQEIKAQNKEFVKRLRSLFAKRYRATLRYEDTLMGDDGKAYVNVDLTKVESPFSIYSYNRRMDPEIFDYIDTQVCYLRAAVPVVINFDDGGKYNEGLKDKIRKYVRRHYSLEYDDRRLEHRQSMFFGFLLLFAGIIMLGFHFAFTFGLGGYEATKVFDELTLIMAWMFVWQSMDTFLISGHHKRVEIYNSGQLALAEITFGKPHLE